jgi:hypothetical protein
LKSKKSITYFSIKKLMIWQQDNDQAAKETVAHNAKASDIHSVPSKGMRTMMTTGAMKILMMKIMTTMTAVCKADHGRNQVMTRITTKIMAMIITMMTIMTYKVVTMITNKEIMEAKIRAGGGNKEGVPARVLAE